MLKRTLLGIDILLISAVGNAQTLTPTPRPLFRYQINQEANYQLKENDPVTSDMSMKIDLPDVGTWYFHIAPIWDLSDVTHRKIIYAYTPTVTPTVTPTPTPLQPVVINLPGGVPLEMEPIPFGSYLMGSPSDEQDRDSDEDPQHPVNINYDFWMGKYEVTQAQWEAVMGNNPSYFSGDNKPVERVSWNDCQAFVTALNQLGQGTFRLPSEAEWEYACRAVTTTRFYWGDDPSYTQIDDYAWYSGNNTPYGSKVVGQKLPNAFGLYDMSGNVYEWCEDDYHSNYNGAPTDGSAWVDSPRGEPGRHARSGLGFRLVRTP